MDSRTPAELAEVRRLRASIVDTLRALGRKDGLSVYERAPEKLASLPDIPVLVVFAAARVAELGGPAAVFITSSRKQG